MSKLLPQPRLPARRLGLGTLLGFAVIVLVVLVGAFFFGRRQLGEKFAQKLGARLAESGVFTGWKSADWEPGGGIRLRGFAVYRDAARRDRLALLDNVQATRGDPSWTRWDKVNFKTANTLLLLGSGATETRLEHLEILLLIQPGKMELREFHASLQGLSIEVKGAFADATSAGGPEAVGASDQRVPNEGVFHNVNLDWLKTVKEWINFQSENDEPVLRMEVHTLPSDSGLSLTMTFDGTQFHWRGQNWDFMQGAMKIPVGRENAPIEIDHVRVGHGGRKVEIAGAFDPASRIIRVSKFDSGIDMLALARVLMPSAVGNLSAARTSGEWHISGVGEIPLDQPGNFHWNGDAALDGELVYASGETNISLQKPAFSVRMEGQVVSISDLKAGIWEGRLDAPKTLLSLPSAEKRLKFETQLTLKDAKPPLIRKSFGENQKQPADIPLDWKGTWRIDAAGEIPVDQPGNFHWNGDAALDGELVYASGETNISLQKPAFSVRMEGQVVSISDLKAGIWEGRLDAPKTLLSLPSAEKKLKFETQLTLKDAKPPLIRKSFGENQKQPADIPLDWKGTWRIDAAGEIPVDQPGEFRWNGNASLDGEFVYASNAINITLQKPAFSVRMEGEVVSISDLKAGLWEGSVEAPKTLLHLPAAKEKLRFETQLTFNGARPLAVRKSFGVNQKQPASVPLDWKSAWRLKAAGEIPLDRPDQFHWSGDAALDGDIYYANGETNIALRKPAFSVRVEDKAVSVSAFKASLWEGNLEAPKTVFYLPAAKQKMRFETQLKLDGAHLQSIIRSFGTAQAELGVVQCDWTGGGEFDPASFAGTGALSIGEAEFARMPIFGSLHGVFGKLAPKFRRDMPSTMSANHRIADGTLSLEDLKLVSDQVRIEAGGNIDLAREYAQFTATGRLRKIPGLATLLTSLLEFEGEGPVDDMRWKVGGISGLNLTGKTVKRATGAAAKAVKGAGRAVKGLIELPGKLLPEKDEAQ